MPARTDIDVVICTYDNARSLDRLLDALERQHEAPDTAWSVLVVDNNCTDATAAVVAGHMRRGALALRIVAEPEQGLTPARRRGVRETGGDWIAFLDDDCLPARDWIRQAAAVARERPAAGAFGGRVTLAWERDPPGHATRHGWAYAEQRHGAEAGPVACLVGAGLVVRRTALERTGWIERPLLADRIGHHLVSGGDVEIALRLGAEHELWYDPRLALRHVLSVRRAEPAYLVALARGLGTSKLYGDAMVLAGRGLRPLAGLLREVGPLARSVASAAHRRRRIDVAVDLAFLRGWLAGLWRLLRLPRAERDALVGCARPVRRS